MADVTLLTINSGSSSLKASLFVNNQTRRDFHYAHIGSGAFANHAEAYKALLHDVGDVQPTAIAHRFVHGGDATEAAKLIDAHERARLESITHLAPLHMPNNLLGVALCAQQFHCPQFACFDTAFHSTLPAMAYRLAIPQSLQLRRYGFHGINYAHVARTLPSVLGEKANGRIVVAHLGHGASLCLLDNLRSVDTTMGYTTAGGVAMGTRSGDLDPGVMLALFERYDLEALKQLVYHQMGLIALSDGESSDMSALVSSQTDSAAFAVAYFAHQVRGAIGSFAAKWGELDAIVFTGGIGEHAQHIRALICKPLGFLGFDLDDVANHAHHAILNTPSAKPVCIIPADEEGEMAHLIREASL
jgi:acetate kinase